MKKVGIAGAALWGMALVAGMLFSGTTNAQDPLGRVWHINEAADWVGAWTRRGLSNVFDASIFAPSSGAHINAVMVVNLIGTHITAERTYSSDGNHCWFAGEMSGNSVAGDYRCINGGPWRWSGYIEY